MDLGSAAKCSNGGQTSRVSRLHRRGSTGASVRRPLSRVLATTLGAPSPAYKQETDNVGAWAVAHASQAAMPYGAVATKAMRVL